MFASPAIVSISLPIPSKALSSSPTRLDLAIYFLSLSLNFDFNLPKNPLARFDFLSVAAELLETELDWAVDDVAAGAGVSDFGGAELEATPVVTVGCVCGGLIGFDMGETSRESG